MHLALSDKIIQQHYAEGILPRHIRPTRCKREGCVERKHFHRHGSYPRKSVYVEELGWIVSLRVQRFQCARCGKTCSIILPTHFKWQRAALSIQQSVALGTRSTTTLLVNFSKRTLQRWKQKWHAWARGLHTSILQWILQLNPDISIDANAWTAEDPLRYLSFLLGQLTQNRHGPVKVTAVARFGGVARQAIPQCLSLSLKEVIVVSFRQGRAHLNPTIRGEPE